MHLTGPGAISPFPFFRALGQFPIVTAGGAQIHLKQQQQIQPRTALAACNAQVGILEGNVKGWIINSNEVLHSHGNTCFLQDRGNAAGLHYSVCQSR